MGAYGLIDPTSERGKKLVGLSQRLRVLHAELSDQTGDMRAEQLRDEVQRVTSALPPQDREAFLKDLLLHFPTWSTVDGGGAAPMPRSSGADPRDPMVLAEKLIEVSKALSEAERQAIGAKLKAAGLGGPHVQPSMAAAPVAAPAPQAASATSVPAGAGSEMRKMLGMPADAPIDGARLTDMAAILAEFTLKLEPWACTYWRDVAPDAKNQVYQVLNKDLAKFMQGDEKVGKEVIAKHAYRLRSLISLLMKGVTEASKQFARDHMARFSVEEISKIAGPGSLMTSKDVLCWKQYVRQMEGVDATGIEKRLKSLLAKDVDAGLSQVIK
ncbi:MAG: hypothetical protein HBSAPP03_26850 [Phycisphaerae bacterium]|nr:MAG: hypothetical protein HBSAPP03_26850 [Phycisphaerae bacterium]